MLTLSGMFVALVGRLRFLWRLYFIPWRQWLFSSPLSSARIISYILSWDMSIPFFFSQPDICRGDHSSDRSSFLASFRIDGLVSLLRAVRSLRSLAIMSATVQPYLPKRLLFLFSSLLTVLLWTPICRAMAVCVFPSCFPR